MNNTDKTILALLESIQRGYAPGVDKYRLFSIKDLPDQVRIYNVATQTLDYRRTCGWLVHGTLLTTHWNGVTIIHDKSQRMDAFLATVRFRIFRPNQFESLCSVGSTLQGVIKRMQELRDE